MILRLVKLLELENNNNKHNATKHNTYRDTNTNQRIKQLMHEIQLKKREIIRHDMTPVIDTRDKTSNVIIMYIWSS